MKQNVVEANRERDLWLVDEVCNVYFIPQGWCDEWSIAAGFTGGLDNEEDGPEIYCYAPTHTYANSPIDTLFVPVTMLQPLRETDEQTARLVHPALAAFLDAINQG